MGARVSPSGYVSVRPVHARLLALRRPRTLSVARPSLTARRVLSNAVDRRCASPKSCSSCGSSSCRNVRPRSVNSRNPTKPPRAAPIPMLKAIRARSSMVNPLCASAALLDGVQSTVSGCSARMMPPGVQPACRADARLARRIAAARSKGCRGPPERRPANKHIIAQPMDAVESQARTDTAEFRDNAGRDDRARRRPAGAARRGAGRRRSRRARPPSGAGQAAGARAHRRPARSRLALPRDRAARGRRPLRRRGARRRPGHRHRPRLGPRGASSSPTTRRSRAAPTIR